MRVPVCRPSLVCKYKLDGQFGVGCSFEFAFAFNEEQAVLGSRPPVTQSYRQLDARILGTCDSQQVDRLYVCSHVTHERA